MPIISFYNRDGICNILDTDDLTNEEIQERVTEILQGNASVARGGGREYKLTTLKDGTTALSITSNGKPVSLEKQEEKAPEGKEFVYRAIEKNKLDLYKNSPEQIPNISGAYFIKLNEEKQNGVYTHRTYDEDTKYLHFFGDKEQAVTYGMGLVKSLEKDVCVIKCVFDKELLDETTGTGFYEVEGRPFQPASFEKRVEYAIPLENYDPKVNFVGVVEDSQQNPSLSALNFIHEQTYLDFISK